MKKVLVTVGLLVVAGLVLALRNGPSHRAAPAAGTLATLASQCASSIDSTGFGQVSVTQNLSIVNQTGEISVNCSLHISRGAKLAMVNSQVVTRHLIILDDTAGAEGVQFEITNSRISAARSGLYVHFKHAADRITSTNSVIDYPVSAWMLVYGEGTGSDEGGGRIELSNTTVNSTNPASQGIRVAVSENGGVGWFSNDRFATPSDNGLALLFAGNCTIANVQGAPASCAPPKP